MSNTFRASQKATPDRRGAIPDRPPSCVLTLDGGIPGTTEFSQLLIIERIVNDLQFRRDDDGELSDESEGNSETDRQLRPCDIFDYIAGSGTGGFFAILFEYFQYSVTEAKAFITSFTNKSLRRHRGFRKAKKAPEEYLRIR
ncbi:hypothetical protein DL96DRAFT_800178 [Flagelloscypha sp. PMI_526]|nr:hypothetical protein DL96DRAFT_800178 [Flagelloscypha sp. PMI_526]